MEQDRTVGAAEGGITRRQAVRGLAVLGLGRSRRRQ